MFAYILRRLALIPLTLLPALGGMHGWFYGVVAFIAVVGMLAFSVLRRRQGPPPPPVDPGGPS